MKSLLLGLVLLASIQVWSAPKEIEMGHYTAVDVETGEVTATLEVRPNKTLNFNVSAPDFSMPEQGCEGTYEVVENNFIADLECPILFFSQVHVEIDITTVNPQSIRSQEGALVPVIIDLLGDEPTMFILKKAD